MKPKKLPKARALWAHPDRVIMCRSNYSGDLTPYAVIPCPSPKQARSLAAFFNLSEEEQVERLALSVAEGRFTSAAIARVYRDQARAILTTLTTPTKQD